MLLFAPRACVPAFAYSPPLNIAYCIVIPIAKIKCFFLNYFLHQPHTVTAWQGVFKPNKVRHQIQAHLIAPDVQNVKKKNAYP
jgi:hypothetical protein